MHSVPPQPPSPISESLRAVTRTFGASDADSGESPVVAARAMQAFDALATHLAQLIGELAVRALLARSVALSRAELPWLAGTISIVQPPDDPWSALRAAIEGRDARTVIEGFTMLLSTFVGLLGRLIGDELVGHLLRDVWPEVFPAAAKETP